MNPEQTRTTQVTLPDDLYQAIEQQAKVHGCSFNNEVVLLLTRSLKLEVGSSLIEEITAWETASDADWLNMEKILAQQEI